MLKPTIFLLQPSLNADDNKDRSASSRVVNFTIYLNVLAITSIWNGTRPNYHISASLEAFLMDTGYVLQYVLMDFFHITCYISFEKYQSYSYLLFPIYRYHISTYAIKTCSKGARYMIGVIWSRVQIDIHRSAITWYCNAQT